MPAKVLAVITARSGSKGIPNKNMKLMDGKPLIYYTVQEALKSKTLVKIGLSTDSIDILNYCISLGINENYVRPNHLAGDFVASLPVVQHYVNWQMEANNFKPDYILLLQPTSPLRLALDIDNSVEKILQFKADSLVSVVESPHSFVPESIMKLEGEYLKPFSDSKNIFQRQQKPKYYGRNGAAIYLCSYDCLMNKNSFYGDSCLAYIMPKERSIDVDDLLDFEWCEYLIKKRGNA